MNKTKIISIVLVTVAVISIAVFEVNKKTTNELTFGMIAGMSGDYAAVGESFAKGVELAQTEWNLAHPDQNIIVIQEDDGFDAKKGLSAYEKLKSVNKIDGLINMTTITIDALYGEVVKSGMPVALGFEQGIEARDDNIVQLWPGTVPAEEKLGEYVKAQGFKNVVVFVDNASSVFQRFADGFKKGYGLPVQEIKVSSDRTDIKSSALRATSVKPDAIVFIITPTSGSLLIKEISSLSKEKIQYVFDANMQTFFDNYTKILGDASLLNGSIVYTVPNIYREEFTSKFKNKFGSNPSVGSETGYNAFMLLAQSYNKDKEKWVNNMKHSTFIGADGKIIFDENGIRVPELKIGTIQNGKLPN
jgi:ABC-type branched-subunit amino acid transport system substrate-binding protein